MEGGTAIADALFGDINPSGKLPFSWPSKISDSPAYALGSQDRNNVHCSEGLLVGYRYFDTRQIAPQFPFGFGLSYTTFRYSNLSMKRQGDTVTAGLDLTNTGNKAGTEVVQLYLGLANSRADRPIHELKAFERVPLGPGESRHLEITLRPESFAVFDIGTKSWVVEPGVYRVEVGSSSRDIRLHDQIEMPGKKLR